MPDISYINLQSPLAVKVEWKRNSAEPPLTLSISALMLNQRTGLIDKLEDFVFYGSKMSNDGILSEDKSIKCDPVDFKKGFGTEGVYKMSIDLKKVKVDVDKIRIVVSINPRFENESYGFDNMIKAEVIICDNNGTSYFYDLKKDAESNCRCVDIGLVKRWGDCWRFEETLQGYFGGLEYAYNDNSSKLLDFKSFGLICIVEGNEEKLKLQQLVENLVLQINSSIKNANLEEARILSLELQDKIQGLSKSQYVDKLHITIDDVYRKCVEDLRKKYAEIAKLKQKKEFDNALSLICDFRMLASKYKINIFDSKLKQLEDKINSIITKLSPAMILFQKKKFRDAKRAFASEGNSEMAQVCTRILQLERRIKEGNSSNSEKLELDSIYKQFKI